jgi:seryl-tRNA synthetase
MHDIKLIRDNPQAFDAGLAARGLPAQSAELIALDDARRAAISNLQFMQERRNAASKEIGQAMGRKDMAAAEALKAEVAGLKDRMAAAEGEQREAEAKLKASLETIPNIPFADVPVGADEHGNVEYRRHGAKPTANHLNQQHFEIGEAMGLMDFEAAARMSGSRFTVLKGGLARLERALGQFMIDLQTMEHGYIEVAAPLIVKDTALYGTGQLPKFGGDLYELITDVVFLRAETNKIANEYEIRAEHSRKILSLAEEIEEKIKYHHVQPDQMHWIDPVFGTIADIIERNSADADKKLDNMRELRKQSHDLLIAGGSPLRLIPTAEVTLTNLVREQILAEEELPLRFTALTPCFRSEAGAAGRDTRGMLRQHQFMKCELVSITTPEKSQEEHERMLSCAEAVLKKLGLHYRTMTLCTGDMGFGSRKTYDIEVWLPGQQAYREISSCSNCGDFQARRMDARARAAGGQPRLVHTLNGSGLAVGRTLIAVMENYLNPDGSVSVPDVLVPYMGGVTRIEGVKR